MISSPTSCLASDTSENIVTGLREDAIRKNHEFHLGCPDSLACLPESEGRPQHTLPVILRCAILGSPQKRLTIREIYAAMEEKYAYYRTAGSTWKVTILVNDDIPTLNLPCLSNLFGITYLSIVYLNDSQDQLPTRVLVLIGPSIWPHLQEPNDPANAAGRRKMRRTNHHILLKNVEGRERLSPYLSPIHLKKRTKAGSRTNQM
jgi:hypothetical protein